MAAMRSPRQIPRIEPLLAVGAGIWLTACAQSVVVDTEFPSPLVEALPVRIGLIFDTELQAFEHHEEIPQQATWTIDIGEANVAMLQPLFEAMFIEAQTVTAVPAPAATGLDGVLKPTLEKFEFDIPLRTRDEFAEVWLQYRLSLYEPDGQLVTEWPVSGYGKAEVSRGNREESVNRAAVVALREVGATISTQFADQPQIRYWLEERRNAAALSADSGLN